MDHGEVVADAEELVEVLADDDKRRPARRQIENGLVDRGPGQRVHAPGWLVDDQHARLAQDLAADHELLKVATREGASRRIRRTDPHVEGLDHAPRQCFRDPRQQETATAHPAGRVARQHEIVAEREARDGGVAVALFRHEGGATAAAGRDPGAADVLAVDADLAGRAGQPFARQRREELVLAVARHPGDAEDLAAPYDEVDVPQGRGMKARRRNRQSNGGETLRAGRAATRRDLADLCSHHEGRKRTGTFLFGVASSDHAATAQDGGAFAQALHVIQPMRDVEQGTPFGLQLVEDREERLRFSRCQHRGRFVEDQQLGILEQAAGDLDPLPLACRERPHGARRFELEAVALRQARDTGVEPALPVGR